MRPIVCMSSLRASGRPEHQEARSGAFQMMLGGSAAQMVRVSIRLGDPFIPEISANKYALNVRFTRSDYDHRPCLAETDVRFDLVFCNL